MRRSLLTIPLLFAALATACIDDQTDDMPEPAAISSEADPADLDPFTGEVVLRVRRPLTPSPSMLLQVVKVETARGVCSGTVIAIDSVLTAGHCFCGEDLVGSNRCNLDAEVSFRPDPRTGATPPRMRGRATVHPGYNPSWIDRQIQGDVAVVALEGTVPAYIRPMMVASRSPNVGTRTMLAGYGRSGSDCDRAAGTLYYAFAEFDGFEDGDRILRYNDPVTCGGDSGGPIMNAEGTVLVGVISSRPPTLSHGWVSKAMTAAGYHAWISSLTCGPGIENACSWRAPMCLCGAGIGDCDDARDCQPGLRCAQDRGASFGYPATTDVCLPAGPPQGTCGCSNSDFGAVCVVDVNQCSAGYHPACTGRRDACGACQCVR